MDVFNDRFDGFNLKMNLERKKCKTNVLGNWTVLVNADDNVIDWKVRK